MNGNKIVQHRCAKPLTILTFCLCLSNTTAMLLFHTFKAGIGFETYYAIALDISAFSFTTKLNQYF